MIYSQMVWWYFWVVSLIGVPLAFVLGIVGLIPQFASLAMGFLCNKQLSGKWW